MKAEAQLNEFVERLKKAAGANLESVILFGSAASQDFHLGFSDINLMCVVRELAASSLDSLAPALQWWAGKQYAAPLVFTRQEVERAADVFAIEMLDICRSHRVLYGENIFQTLHVPMERHRIQLEHELRTKLLFLRQGYLAAAGDSKKILALMMNSLSNFITLFRHTLITMGETPLKAKHEIVTQLAGKIGFGPRPFLDLLEVREHRREGNTLDAQAAFAGYLMAIDQVIQAVDAL